ncbi:carboxypeptidase regulatory-like domain-containing protein [Paenibacillus agaridevorans]|uniref:carboxypeptidase regulatory-like domain-containing protein n=1 Tax=Paenibacillus agaridevorans TaxID=171404 RepID=UPI001FE2C174|nr:carboxypeptidase regulatory-like domain-containing protein [Paenibacillus agaridevorans]
MIDKRQWFKMIIWLCLIAVAVPWMGAAPSGHTAHAAEEEAIRYYVSPDGSDDNDGSLEQPFLTLGKARDVIRGMNQDMSGDIVVYVRDGEYQVTDTLVLDERDSGTNGYEIRYTNYPDETPVFSGGRKVDGWTEGENGILTADAQGLKFRDLWVNGNRATRARSESFKIVNWDENNRLINLNESDLAAWNGVLDPQLEIVVVQHWVRFYSRLDSYQTKDNLASLVMMEDAKKTLFDSIYPDRAANQSIYFENSMAYLDEQGEWLLDEREDKLYYIPLPGEGPDDIDVRIGSIETFIDFKGSSKDRRVEHVTLSGLTFEYTNYQYPIDVNYFVPGQAGLADGIYDGAKRPPAAIQLEAAESIKLERNVIRHAGSTAIDIRRSTSNNEVAGNTILDIGGSGIFEGLFSEPGAAGTTDPLIVTRGNVIRNNYLNGISLTSCGVGIAAGFTQDLLIEHNEIANTDYSGISAGWGWTANRTSLKNITIRNNNIYGAMKKLADGASIYTLSNTPNSVISGNYIHDTDSSEFASNYPVAAIYLDQETEGYHIADNVLKRVGQRLNFNNIPEEDNTLSNNDSEDPAIINRAGLQPEYWDIVPDAIMDNADRSLSATRHGSFRINGSARLQDESAGGAAASILINGSPVWSGSIEGLAPATFTINVDVVPGDVISFGQEENVVWESRVKPEVYTPNLVIEGVAFDGIVEGETKIDYLNKAVTVVAAEDVDVHNLNVAIATSPGTSLERVGGDSADYSKEVRYKVLVNDGSVDRDFKDGVKFKYWRLKVLKDTERVSIPGYNIASQLKDADNWTAYGGTKKVGRHSISFEGGYALYEGRSFENEWLTFQLGTEASGWPSIVFRAQHESKDPLGPGSAAYIAVIKPEGIELQRFNDGGRTVFYGNVGGDQSKYGEIIPNVFMNYDNEYNLVQVGAKNTDEGVRLLMYINGKLVFDCLDTFEGRIDQAGYFGTYQASNEIRLSPAPAAIQLNDAIKDTENWYASANAPEAAKHSLTMHDGYAIYRGQTFENELLSFNMTTKASGWPSILFRAQHESDEPIGPDSSAYIAVIKPEGIELQRFNDGIRTVFYGNIGGDQSKYGDIIPNTFFDYERESNLVQIGAVNTDEGVRLLMHINGELVFDCVDTFEGRIEQAGYFGTYQAGNEIRLSPVPTAVQLNDAIRDAGNWYVSAKAAEATEHSLTLQDGYAIYQGQTFENELLSFNMGTEASGWPSIVFRAQHESDDPIGPDSSAYIVVIKPEGIELQRFNDGVRTVFYGNIGGDQSKYGDIIPNTFFDYERESNLVQIGAVNTDKGVRLLMYLNGKLVFDCLDTFEGRIEQAGYVGTYQAGNKIKLGTTFMTSAGEGSNAKDLLQLEIQRAKQLLQEAEYGTELGQYSLWAKDYLEASINIAQEVYDNPASTESELAAMLNRMKSAKQTFMKSQNVRLNVALGKSAVSSEGDNPSVNFGPDRVTDGVVSFDNGWSAESGAGGWPEDERVAPWVTIDLEDAYKITGVEVVARPDGEYDGERRGFQIQASNDPNFAEGSYTVLGEVGSTAFKGPSRLFDVTDDNKYRYIRYAKMSIDYAFVSEIKVYGQGIQEWYSVSGVIRDRNGQPVSGAAVSIYSFDNREAALGSAMTDNTGSYTIDASLVSGKYWLKATGKGGMETSDTIFIPYAHVADADLVLDADTPNPAEPFSIEGPTFTDLNGATIDSLAASSTVLGHVTMTNQLSVEHEAALIIALYSPKGTMESMSYVGAQIQPFETVTLSTGLSTPAAVNGNYVKVFVWDSLQGMQPLAEATTFK